MCSPYYIFYAYNVNNKTQVTKRYRPSDRSPKLVPTGHQTNAHTSGYKDQPSSKATYISCINDTRKGINIPTQTESQRNTILSYHSTPVKYIA